MALPSGPRRLSDTALTATEHILGLASLACQESALHGLGHWQRQHASEVARIIDAFVLSQTELTWSAMVVWPRRLGARAWLAILRPLWNISTVLSSSMRSSTSSRMIRYGAEYQCPSISIFLVGAARHRGRRKG